MQADIHPNYHAIKVSCSCGNEFETKSTIEQERLMVEVCNQCHPFYTGKQKLIDISGRVEDFNRRFGKSEK